MGASTAKYSNLSFSVVSVPWILKNKTELSIYSSKLILGEFEDPGYGTRVILSL